MSESPVQPALPRDTGRIALIAATFPLPSETFVYREVRDLRQRGWTVETVSLNDAPPNREGYGDLFESRIVVYGSGLAATLAGAAMEILSHPIQALKTLLMSVRDLIDPGEATPAKMRMRLPLQALAAIGLAHRLRGARVQWIHCHFAHAPTTVGMYAAKQLAVPFSFTGHANDLFQRRCLLLRKLQRAALVSCISRWHSAWYQSICPGISAKCELVRCGVDTYDWRPPENRRPADRLRIVTVGRLVEKKGIDTLIQAFRELNRRDIPATLAIAGTGEQESRLRALAAANGSDPIQWLGEMDNAKVPALLADADVLALPCRDDAKGDRDGIPVVLMEAMACGLPVVSGDLPAIRELIDDGVSGLLVPGSQADALADALAKLAADPDLRRKLGAAGRRKIEAEFSLTTNIDRLEARLKDALRTPK
jgi:glycosyltransferase involved in cell wall biosynthesis